MERNGDVIAELNTCNTPNFSLLNNSYISDKYKMCKDDIVTPLFCSASDCLSKSIIMGSEHKSAEGYINSDDENINLFSDYIGNRDFNMPVIESSVDSINDCCDSPIWEKPPILQSFSPIKIENFKPKNSFINGNKLNITDNSIDLCKSMSFSNADNSHVSINNNDIDSKLLLDYEASTSSSSSTEELESCPEIRDVQPENNSELIESSEVDSNHNMKNSVVQDFDRNIDDLPPSPLAPQLPEIKQNNSNPTSPAKSDGGMPELIPSLICLDDGENDVVSVTENKKEQFEIINVADSPEMPTLIPFTSERDEVFQVKSEYISEDENVKPDDPDSRDTVDENFQPQVLLKRLSVNNISKDDDDKNLLSAYFESSYYKPVIEGPEIEEIEGVRFFQFRSKKEMDEFNKKVPKIEADEDMIIPTKTTDITQIKGWRTKFFAPESQFQLQSLKCEDLKTEKSNLEDKTTANHLNEAEHKNEEKKDLHSETPASEKKKTPTTTKCNVEESSEDKNDHCDDSSSDSEEDEKKTRFKEVKDEGNKNPMSAFVSEELDKYLLNSAALNISLLQKVNPNIIPIPPDAKILSIGKLRKTDDPPLPPHLIFKRKSDQFKTEKIDDDSADPVITLDVSPGSPNIITLESSEESDEDVPVAALKSKKKVSIKKEGSKGFKRNLELECEAPAKRVVLRLTKEGSGVSKGYKVSEITCKKDKSALASRESSPSSGTSSLDISQDAIEIPTNGSLPIIKKTLFSEKNEKRLVNEFLNNLNMYGTRKDVAMLVQSNQSLYYERPTLTSKICTKAISVLVSNKEYFEEKQKSKKKLKTWQKYLPKKIDKQNVKMKLSKRKSRIERLLNDAESMIPTERGKRSIRLPARYLDSAVLAASEWVSPVITIDDSVLVKPKEEIIEDSDKCKTNEDNVVSLSSPSSSEKSSSSESEGTVEKSAVKLPQKRTFKMKKTLAKKKKLKDSTSKLPTKTNLMKSNNEINNIQIIKAESSSDSSNEDDVAESTRKKTSATIISEKTVIRHRKKNEVSTIKSEDASRNNIEKSVTSKVVVDKRRKSKESLMKAVGDISASSDKSSKNSAEAADVIAIVPSKNKSIAPYPRTYVMPDCSCKHSSRTTLFDYKSKQFICAFCNSMKKLVFPANSKKIEPNSLDDQKDELCTLIKDKDEDLQSHNSVNPPGNLNFAVEKPEVPAPNVAHKNQLNISDISTSIPISFTNQFLKQQESKTQTMNQNVTSSTVQSNSVGSKYILLLQPVKTVANTNNVPLLPVRHDLTAAKINQPTVAANSNSLLLNNKSKPPILMRKTSTGIVPQIPPTASPQISNSLPTISNNVNERTSINMMNTNSKLPVSSSIVAAYKVGSNYYICNPVMSPTETRTVTASNVISPVQTHCEGPVITSVQSVQVDEKGSEDTALQSENTAENSSTILNNHHNYHKKQRHNRRKSPLMQLNYNDDIVKRKDAEENMDVDIETVDDSCNEFLKKKLIKIDESDSDISDNECASIFLSSADKLRSVYSKKTIKERQRRLQIKSGFETLKVSSRWFKNANTCKDILSMAVTVIESQQKSDKLYNLAKKRLKIHNSMLMGKLTRLIDGIEPTNIRNKTKMQIIRALALDQDKYRNKRSILPLLSEGCKGSAFSSDSERKNLVSNAPDIEIVVENAQHVPPQPMVESKPPDMSPQVPVEENNSSPVASPQPIIGEVKSVQKTEQDDSHSIQAISLDEVLDLAIKSPPEENKKDGKIMLESSEEVNKTPSDSSKMKFEGLKQKVKEALEKNDKEESSDSDTEELGSDSFNLSGFSDDDFDLRICTGDNNKEDSPNRDKSSADDENFDKSPTKEYPGLIPLFHPKVLQKNVSPSQSPLPPKIVGESSHRTNTARKSSGNSTGADEIQLKDDDWLIPLFHTKVVKKHVSPSQSPMPPMNMGESSHTIKGSANSAPESVAEEIQIDDDDDEVAILDNPPAPSSIVGKWSNPSTSNEQVELAMAAETASKLFGPCKVQKICLKNGKTVFAYEKKNAPSETEPSVSSAKSASINKSPALQTNTNGVRNFRDIFNTENTKKRAAKTNRKRITVPEEIVISDSSDDDSATKNDCVQRTSQDSSSNKSGALKEKDDDDQNKGDKSDSPKSSL